MNLRDLLTKHGLAKIRLDVGVIQADMTFDSPDRDAAWEMLTRIITQPPPDDAGDEKAALESVHALFPVAGRCCAGAGSVEQG